MLASLPSRSSGLRRSGLSLYGEEVGVEKRRSCCHCRVSHDKDASDVFVMYRICPKVIDPRVAWWMLTLYSFCGESWERERLQHVVIGRIQRS